MSDTKLQVLVGLLVITLLITFMLAQIFSNYTPIIYIILTLLVFLMLLLTFDRVLWRLPFLHSLGVIDVPYLGGEWQGSLTTSFDDQSRITDVRLIIKQSWTSIEVYFYTKKAVSTSINASILQDESDDYVLTYTYHAMPRENHELTDPPHIGLTVLRLTEPTRLSGYYHYYYQDAKEETFIRGQLVFERRPDVLSPKTAP